MKPARIIYKLPDGDAVLSLPYDKVQGLCYHLQNLMNDLVDKYEAGETAKITLEIRESK